MGTRRVPTIHDPVAFHIFDLPIRWYGLFILTGILTGVAVLGLYGISLPAVTDYVLYMRVEHTAYMNIRFDFAYFVYVIFAVAVLVRYAWLTWHALRGEAPTTLLDSTQDRPAP